MQPSEEFTGLGMPVFTAFGWAGEENALQYAYSQLAQFITLLHAALPPEIKADLPYFGLSKEDQSVFLAASEDVETDLQVSFNTRLTSLEMQLALTDDAALTRALKQITKDPAAFLLALQQIDPQWDLRIQQLQVDEESGEKAFYQDIFKGTITQFVEENVAEILDRAAYLHSDDKWVTPISLSLRLPAEQVAVMKETVVPVLIERLQPLEDAIAILRGRAPKKHTAPKPAKEEQDDSPAEEPVVPPQVLEQPTKPLSQDEFTYISELKPLHIERGFINMTPEYWPFFALTARTESRPVTTIAGDLRDEESSVWRLQPNDLARLVVGPRMQRWLADNFAPNEYIQLTVNKINDTDIEILLEPIS